MIHSELLRVRHMREDGWLSELVSMAYQDQPFQCVHTYIVTINPGMTRARHYHRNKEEWLALTHGKLTLLLEDTRTRQRERIELSAKDPETKIIYIPPLVAHAIRNPGEAEAGIIVFSRNPEDREDTIPYEVGQ
jgi:oxalate decarboxylase/phosphoglucose isomerase-like protein (cupin superfamily)